MDEHKPQEQAPEKVPARRKSGRMRGWKASILACVTCILVTALVTSMIFVGKFGGSSNYKLALKFAQVDKTYDPNPANRKVYDQLLKKYDTFIEATHGYTEELAKLE